MRRLIENTAKKIKGEDYNLDKRIPITYLTGYAKRRLNMLLRGFFKTFGVEKRGKHVFVGRKVSILCKKYIRLGSNVTIQDRVCIDALSQNGITIGSGSSIGSGTIIRCSGNYHKLGIGFTMGNNSSLADNCFVGATGGVWIGDDVIGGQYIRFHASNHNFDDTSVPIKNQGISSKGIRIGNNCWIGSGVVFCDGVVIGDGCVIGANTVVTKSFPTNSVIVGNPAKKLRSRGETEKYNVNEKA